MITRTLLLNLGKRLDRLGKASPHIMWNRTTPKTFVSCAWRMILPITEETFRHVCHFPSEGAYIIHKSATVCVSIQISPAKFGNMFLPFSEIRCRPGRGGIVYTHSQPEQHSREHSSCKHHLHGEGNLLKIFTAYKEGDVNSLADDLFLSHWHKRGFHDTGKLKCQCEKNCGKISL